MKKTVYIALSAITFVSFLGCENKDNESRIKYLPIVKNLPSQYEADEYCNKNNAGLATRKEIDQYYKLNKNTLDDNPSFNFPKIPLHSAAAFEVYYPKNKRSEVLVKGIINEKFYPYTLCIKYNDK